MAQDLFTRIASRSDTLANWTSSNPVLLKGEIAIVFDGSNQLFKVGDGSTAFNDLSFSFYDQFASEQINATLLRAKSISQGYGSQISGIGGVAAGYKSQVSANFAQAHGYQANVSSDFGFVWNGDNTTGTTYSDHGVGSFSINPKAGLSGFYVGDRNLNEIISSEVPLSNYVKLSSYTTQDLKTNLSIDGFVAIGAATVQTSPDANYIRYDAPQAITNAQKQQLATNGGYRLQLVNLTGSVQSGYLTFQLEDYAVNCIEITSNSYPVKIILPDIVDASTDVKRAREFIAKVKVTTSLPPSCTFVKSSSDTSVGFETDSEYWQDLYSGVNLFTFKETERA